MLTSREPKDLQCIYIVDYDDPLGVDMDQSPADVAVFAITEPCEVVEAGALVTETCAGSTSTPVVAFDKRPTAGSDTNRGAADIANLVLSTSAAGKQMYDLVAVGTRLEPGQEVVVQLVTAAVGSPTGHIRPYLKVAYSPEIHANLSNMVLTA